MIEFPLTPALRDRMGDAYDAHEQGRMGEARRICEELLAINPAIFAANGLWYDSLGWLARLRKDNPQDPELAIQWNELLRAGKLEALTNQPLN